MRPAGLAASPRSYGVAAGSLTGLGPWAGAFKWSEQTGTGTCGVVLTGRRSKQTSNKIMSLSVHVQERTTDGQRQCGSLIPFAPGR